MIDLIKFRDLKAHGALPPVRLGHRFPPPIALTTRPSTVMKAGVPAIALLLGVASEFAVGRYSSFRYIFFITPLTLANYGSWLTCVRRT